MKVLLFSPFHQHTGNNTTSQRIMSYLSEDGHKVDVTDCYGFQSSSEFEEVVENSKPDCVIAVHAYRSGLYLTDCQLPLVVVFGGTDLNEHFKCEQKLNVMTKVVQKARCLVAFTRPMFDQANKLWPDVNNRLILQPQAVLTSPAASFRFSTHLLSGYGIQPECDVFLLLAGLRPVKDVLFLVQAFAEWHHQENLIHLVIAGPELDEAYTEEVKKTVIRLPGVHLSPELPLVHAHAAIQQSFALVNSSRSEGMSSTILEAIDLEVPVIARDIPGNKAIITHKETGLLFSTPQEFIFSAKCLRKDACFRKQITQKAKNYLMANHSTVKERATYSRIVAEITNM